MINACIHTHIYTPRVCVCVCRPAWDSSTTPEELELCERESFLTWRRSLVCLQEDERLTMTPFERNLEFWRQLWRVVERRSANCSLSGRGIHGVGVVCYYVQ